MKIKRFLLFLVVCSITFVCLFYINKKYNRLARYPYEDKRARELINRYLSDQNIEYIIEYSIEPDYFINYIESKGFNIYHVSIYNQIKSNYYYLTYDEIVDVGEKLISNKKIDNSDSFIESNVGLSYNELLEKLN